MIDREWVSIVNPDDVHDRYVFDVSFLLSNHRCIYGAGCPGTDAEPDPETGCCRLGAHYVDREDRDKVESMVGRLGARFMQFHDLAVSEGVSTEVPGEGAVQTRLHDGACIFLNRGDFPTGPGCALHHYALARGEHPMTHKPEVCWIVPLRREVECAVADDGEELWTTTITSYDRGAWGAGGAEFGWWCTDSREAYVASDPVYRSMEAELRAMTSDAVYDELVAYLDDRCARARKPLPFPVFVR